MVPKARKSNRFCRPQDTNEWSKARREHYDAINTRSYDLHRTIEVRMHPGTTDLRDVLNWIKLLLNIASYNEKMNKKMGNARQIRKELKLSDELSLYVAERLKRFAS